MRSACRPLSDHGYRGARGVVLRLPVWGMPALALTAVLCASLRQWTADRER
jgi:hypothetical protein